MNDPSSSDEARDRQQLEALAAARAEEDITAEREALRLLVGPYWDYAYGIAYSRLASSGNREADAEDIAAAVISRLLKALTVKTDFGKPFWKVAYDNLVWEVAEYYRARGKNRSTPQEPEKLLRRRESDDAPPTTETDVRDFRAYLDVLSQLDREIVTERILFDLEPEQIAAKHAISVGNVYTRLSRSLRRLREHPELRNVRNRYEDTA
jgi:RNA polymerase sigma factor (sigma-70 family)